MLVDIVERLSNWKHASFRRDGSTLETMMEAANEITSLRAELEIAKKDGERYQWLRKRAFLNRFGWVFENIKYYKEPTTIDEDIDNAMKGNG